MLNIVRITLLFLYFLKTIFLNKQLKYFLPNNIMAEDAPVYGGDDWYYGQLNGCEGEMMSDDGHSDSDLEEQYEGMGGFDTGFPIEELYFEHFHSETGFFRNEKYEDTFAPYYNSEDIWTADGGFKSGRLALDNIWPVLSLPRPTAPVSTTVTDPPPASPPVGSCGVGEELPTRVSPMRGLLHSPASRFMIGPEGPGIIITIDATTNRKQLQDRISTKGDVLNSIGMEAHRVYVGYVDKVATCTALLMIPPGEARDHALLSVPTARLAIVAKEDGDIATVGDVGAFMKPGKSSSSSATVSNDNDTAPVTDPSNSSDANLERIENEAINRAHGALRGGLLSKVRLAEVLGCELSGIEAALRDARVLFVDCEHALVTKNSFAIPLEISIVELLPPPHHDADDNDVELVPTCIFHGFIHPGVISDLHTAMTLSTCTIPNGGHGIPLDGATFLNDDYQSLSDQLLPFLNPAIDAPSSSAASTRKTILVNKGPTTSDLHALRWVLCASNAIYHTNYDVSIEAALRIPMFDISIIEEVMTSSSSSSATTTTWEDCCWYHQVLQNPSNRTTMVDRIPTEMTYYTPHCARQDAFKMALKFRDLLQ